MFDLTNPDAFRRRAAGASLVLAPLCLLLGMIVDPLEAGGDDVLGYASNPAATGISATLLHYAWVLWVPGVIGLVHLVRRRGVVLAHLAGAVTVLGLINFSSLMIADFFDIVLYQRLPVDQATRILEDAAQPAMVVAWQIPGMIGSFLGLILVAVAYTRAGRAGWWFPVGVLAGMVVWLVGARSWNPVFGYAGPAILLAAFGAVGVAMIRMTDEEWNPAREPVPA
ncbi:hypothetical protein [Streptosporangium roseum]|uniref:DUF4386 family protein n=1 Tax=Streptosporangium roseum (strain ATCC 12428 / DSM 43021 / JCM 3005 / KCTC 9067 / NCIMB 10171 / NRRL 2505 / NI 9100) TaxID=479432 RepID=D2ARD8_STRRD|nr:hypothetical protein [Streptosporangium roseum]ACZ90278.1 hypothetical protein Sros_7604 [Streptosporangium roseum DSM 43021]